MEQRQFELEFAGRRYNTLYIRERESAICALSQLMQKDCVFGFDVETMPLPEFIAQGDAGLDPHRSTCRTLQLCDDKNIVVFDLMLIGDNSIFHEFLSTKRLMAHNAMFEMQRCQVDFKVPDPMIGCTRLAARLISHAIRPDDSGVSFKLGDLVKELLGIEMQKDISHLYWHVPELNFEQVKYAALDAPATLLLAEKLSNGVRKHGLQRIYSLYKDSQAPLSKMQITGMGFNREKHRDLIAVWKGQAWEAKKELLTLTKLDDVTPSKIAEYLQASLDPKVLAIWPRTEKGHFAVNADALSEFSWHPVVEPFARFQKATILASTFGMELNKRVHDVTARLHAQYKLGGARTGRLSSSAPNLQNMPRSKEMRGVFVAPEGRVLCVADFNQIELRVAAELSRDPMMLKVYRDGVDLHALTAETVSGRKLASMAEKEAENARQQAKALNFGLLFGLGAAKFQHYAKKQYKVDITEEQAFESVRTWRELYAGYRVWQQAQAEDCERTLVVATVSGKKRKLNSENYYGASANTPVQGTASEIMLQSLVLLNKVVGRSAKLINTVHDEIVIECDNHPGTIKAVSDTMHERMTEAYRTIFPNGVITDKLVKVKYGLTWADGK